MDTTEHEFKKPTTTFQSAMNDLFDIHTKEVEKLKLEMKNLKENFSEARKEWQNRLDQAKEENHRLKKEKSELGDIYRKMHQVLQLYREKFGKIPNALQESEPSLPSPAEVDSQFLKSKNFVPTAPKGETFPTAPNGNDSPTVPRGETSPKRPLETETDEVQILYSRPGKKQKPTPSHSSETPKPFDFSQKTKKKKTKNSIEKDEEYSVVDLEEESDSGDHYSPPSDPHPKKPFKYVDVVRKKAERDLLPSHECEQCQQEQFLDAVEGEKALTNFDRRAFVSLCSRHKALWEAPLTPPGFWEVSFPESETQD